MAFFLKYTQTNDAAPLSVGAEHSFLRRFMNHSLQGLQRQMRQLLDVTAESIEEAGPEATAYTLGLIAVAARLMVADGPINAEEREAFRACFPMPEGYEAVAGQLLEEALTDPSVARLYARQWRALYPGHLTLHGQALERLLQLALADGGLQHAEFRLLCEVAEAVDLPLDAWESIWSRQFQLPEGWAERSFRWGLAKEHRLAWRQALRKLQLHYHPDRWLSMNDSAYGLLACRALQRYAAMLNHSLSER